MMISLEDVFEFYSKGSPCGASFEPSNLTWKEILECLQNSDAGDFAYATIGSDKKTLLHCHFTSRYITGENNDEIAVARTLIERSIDMGGSTVQLGEMQEHGDSVLTVSDHDGNTPLHDLFELFSFRQHLHIQYVELIIEMSARVYEKRKTSFYWNELMLQQNKRGCTPLHMMAENPSIEYLFVSLVLKKCDDAWGSRCLIHPLLQGDNDGELPIHSIVCDEADTRGQWIEAFVDSWTATTKLHTIRFSHISAYVVYMRALLKLMKRSLNNFVTTIIGGQQKKCNGVLFHNSFRPMHGWMTLIGHLYERRLMLFCRS
jgi:hypothetical protein